MQWKAIKQYEGYYEVSDTGRVRSLDRIVPDKKTGYKRLTGKEMKLSINAAGYYVVNLRKEHKSNVVPVHRLVAEAFLINENNLPTINHRDGDKRNNNVVNLEWVTYAENNTHALRNHLRKPRGNAVLQITPSGKIVNSFNSACEAARITGISRGMISHCLNNRSKLAGGYKWSKIGKCNDYLVYESTADVELPLEAQERIESEDIVCSDGNI